MAISLNLIMLDDCSRCFSDICLKVDTGCQMLWCPHHSALHTKHLNEFLETLFVVHAWVSLDSNEFVSLWYVIAGGLLGLSSKSLDNCRHTVHHQQ